jgi:uncharacterized protein (TIGR04141 family)
MGPKAVDLTIYQIKKDWQDLDDIVTGDGLSSHELEFEGNVTGYLYIKKPKSNPPKWGRLFAGYIDLSEFGRGASPAAVLLIKLDGRWYAVTFGAIGRFLIDQDAIEDRFGLLTVLNSIPDDQIRSIEKTALDARATHSKVQTSREAQAQDFGVDIERDLVRAVTGTPSDASLAQRLHGMDALRASLKMDLEELPEKIREFARRSKAKTYRKNFSWIDHIAEVRNSRLKERLDLRLLSCIHTEDYERCWMAVPELIDWGTYTRFRYGGYKKKNPLHHDVSLSGWIVELCESVDGISESGDISLQLLQSKRVRCLGEEEIERHVWPVYKCIYAEVDYDGNSYAFSSEKWYLIAKEYAQNVDEFFANVHRYEIALPTYDDKDEGAYNIRVCAAGNGSMALMDKKMIHYGGGPGKLEFCDLFTHAGDMVHVKRYSQSSGLSHLFSQGTVSGELFRSQKDFRVLVNDLLPQSHKLVDPLKELDPDEYRVVYAIISKQGGDDLTLPFFSRLNLRAAVTRLRSYGFRVSIAKIPIDNGLAMTKTYLS